MTDGHVKKLQAGETVKFRPCGNFTSPKINSGDQVTVVPCIENELRKGDSVFCMVKGQYYVHLIQALRQKMGGGRFQIGTGNRTNGTIGVDNIFGKVTAVEARDANL